MIEGRKQHERMTPAARKPLVLNAGLEVAKLSGIGAVTRVAAAEAGGFSTGLVNRYFENVTLYRKAILREAKRQGVVLPTPPRKK